MSTCAGRNRNRNNLPSPLKAVLNRRMIAWSGKRSSDGPRARSGRLAKASAGEGRYVLFAEPPQPLRRVFLRRKGLILLRPFSADRRTIPRKATCGELWVPFAVKRYKTPRGTRRKWASCFCEAIAVPYERTNMGEHANKGEHPMFACSCVRDESKPKPPAAT